MRGSSLSDRLVRRELGDLSLSSKPRGIYGDRFWVSGLDIINELNSHSGCVNALSWSKSGSLLASGSDDVHVNIHTYQPDHSDLPFQLSTSISTGHTANIFSVKFMPHSNDRTLISAAGDGEIRIFDIEYAGRSSVHTTTQGRSLPVRAGASSRGSTRFLSEADANAKVFRSHSDRVKRLVTESSPFLFLSCSEDGDVRQWDIRQPSSAYPRPAGVQPLAMRRNSSDADVPPPLISYKRHQLDLNTISCSASQPHYIALGGAHLHCFLHDRRMLGRDKLREMGQKVRPLASANDSLSEADENLLSEATQCVRRFAPKGQARMKTNDSGHITACKISDANPNEMVVSWSGDWIYNFDLLRSPDAKSRAESATVPTSRQRRHVVEPRERKRKRGPPSSLLSHEGATRSASKAPKNAESSDEDQEGMALRVHYENGQSENIPLVGQDAGPSEDASSPPKRPSAAGPSLAIAKAAVSVRKTLFTLEDGPSSEQGPCELNSSFTKVLKGVAKTLPLMDSVMRDWRYPMSAPELEINLQKTLRENRDRSRRFFQACGVLSRILGGDPLACGAHQSFVTAGLNQVQSSRLEKDSLDSHEQFYYDFLKAICLWLGSGIGALVHGFASAHPNRARTRNPLPLDGSAEDVDDHLIPYLLSLASDRSIPNVDASRFEVDANRTLIKSEKAAVIAFSRAIKIPFEDLSSAVEPSEPSQSGSIKIQSQNRTTARRYWAFKVGRGILMNAGEGINFAFVDRAFGGLGHTSRQVRAEEQNMARQHETINSDEEEAAISSIGLTRVRSNDVAENSEESDEEMVDIDDIHDALRADHDDFNENGDDEDEAHGESDDEDSGPQEDSEESGDDEVADLEDTDYLFRSAFTRSANRRKVYEDVPCVGPQLHYRGAANVRTVKDVNFYGPQDEYVVSGSDSGHFFLWDRASGELLNILEGDGEVVNVVQGHPYEPMLAVSGIDHSIKVFSADARMRRNARRGIGITAPDSSHWSSLRLGGREAMRRVRQVGFPAAADDDEASDGESVPARVLPDSDYDSSDNNAGTTLPIRGLASRRRMHEEYRITSQNDVDRRGGQREAFITRSMLAQLAARMRLRRARPDGNGNGDDGETGAGDGGDEEDDDDDDGEGVPVIDFGGGRVVVGQDCNVQ